ncbi:hypothetical protein JYG38_04005 [Pseudomonas rhodesiae]|uniref:hypothetical protein n=1 Tax=Pseudomonas rhodesiae TaxID=76760 RepID=UPI001BD04CEC|nr:hypothetical protein [Pseudomonas rhodesiae]QVN02628.1 hypothetical protein JYG38_04005 [Pseudomonas rhodesiae]
MLPPLSVIAPTAAHLTPADACARGLRRQLHIHPEPLTPGMLPLQRDVRWILDTVLEKVVNLAGDPRDKQAIEALHRTLSNSPARLELTAEELPDCYVFFKKAEHLLKRHRSADAPDIEADYRLCRALKWQFRAAASDARHAHLTQGVLSALGYIDAGGKRINHRHLGYEFALESTRQLSAGPYLSADSLVEITDDQRIRSTRVVALLGKLNSTLANVTAATSGHQLGIGYLSSREYPSLGHYADARSHSVRTSLSENIARTVRNLPAILSDRFHLQRHRDYSAQSQPYTREALAGNGLGDVELPCLQHTDQPLMTERGFKMTADIKLALDVFSFLKVNTSMALTLQRTVQSKTLDILGLYDTAPGLARQQLAARQSSSDTLFKLLEDLNAHVASSSRHFVQQLNSSRANAVVDLRTQQAHSLLERYVLLQSLGPVDPVVNADIRDLIQQHRALLRPQALCVYQIKAPSQILSGSVSASVSSQAEGGKGVTLEVSHRTSDDPHLSGDYLSIDIAPLKCKKGVAAALREVLAALGKQTFDWDELIRSISASLLDPARQPSIHVLVKIKHGQPVVLLTRHTRDKHRDLALPEPISHYTGVQLQSLRTRQSLHKEQWGTDSLDHLLPIARRYLANPDDRPGWDLYIQAHSEDLSKLLDAMGRQSPGSVLNAELDALRRIGPALDQAVETLTQQAADALAAPTPQSRARTRQALDQMLLAYMPHYVAKVSEAWTLQ